MDWIDVRDDLPPAKVRVLAHIKLTELSPYTISDAYFEPGSGWYTYGFDGEIYEVFHWHPMLNKLPTVKKERKETHSQATLRSLERLRAVYEKLDDSPQN